MAGDNAGEQAIRIVCGAAMLMLGLGVGAMKAYLVLVEGEPAPQSVLGMSALVVLPFASAFVGWRWGFKAKRRGSR